MRKSKSIILMSRAFAHSTHTHTHAHRCECTTAPSIVSTAWVITTHQHIEASLQQERRHMCRSFVYFAPKQHLLICTVATIKNI